MTPRAIVFDFDGVICDTETIEFDAWSAVYRTHGATLQHDRWALGIGTKHGFDPFADLEEQTERSLARDAVIAQVTAFVEQRPLTPLPGVVGLIAEARGAGVALAVASSSRERWVRPRLEQLALAEAFDVLSCYDDGIPAKPAPDLYDAAVRALGVETADAVAIEDSPNGIAAAKAAGLYCLAVPGPMTRALRLDAADRIVGSLADVSLATLRA